jgi:hypothetical protein
MTRLNILITKTIKNSNNYIFDTYIKNEIQINIVSIDNIYDYLSEISINNNTDQIKMVTKLIEQIQIKNYTLPDTTKSRNNSKKIVDDFFKPISVTSNKIEQILDKVFLFKNTQLFDSLYSKSKQLKEDFKKYIKIKEVIDKLFIEFESDKITTLKVNDINVIFYCHIITKLLPINNDSIIHKINNSDTNINIHNYICYKFLKLLHLFLQDDIFVDSKQRKLFEDATYITQSLYDSTILLSKTIRTIGITNDIVNAVKNNFKLHIENLFSEDKLKVPEGICYNDTKCQQIKQIIDNLLETYNSFIK